MKARLLKLLEQVSDSLWFVPAVLVVLSTALALGLLEVDRRTDLDVMLPLIFQGGADSARQLLSAVASSTITVMGVAFSVMVVALTLASSQFTPRVLYSFTRDRGNQVVMGVFIGTFTYSLIVLRTIRDVEEDLFVPEWAITGGTLHALVAVAALIYFIDHAARSIRAGYILEHIARITRPLIEQPFPGAGFPAERPEPLQGNSYRTIDAQASGYVQLIELDSLLSLAEEHDLFVKLEQSPGDFVLEGMPLMHAAPEERLDDELRGKLCDTVVLGSERTMQQDPEFGLRQMMDVAVRALSPGVNDPTTAINCVDQISALLRLAASRDDSNPFRCAEQEGRVRVYAPGPTFRSLLGHGVDQIRQHGTRDLAVALRLLRAMGNIGTATTREDRRELLWLYARTIEKLTRDHVSTQPDLRVLQEELEYVREKLGRNEDPERS